MESYFFNILENFVIEITEGFRLLMESYFFNTQLDFGYLPTKDCFRLLMESYFFNRQNMAIVIRRKFSSPNGVLLF